MALSAAKLEFPLFIHKYLNYFKTPILTAIFFPKFLISSAIAFSPVERSKASARVMMF
jgi:branched-subunit amino acid transport protein